MLPAGDDRVLVCGRLEAGDKTWLARMRECGTTVVGNVDAASAGAASSEVPVWRNARQALNAAGAVDCAMITGPGRAARAAALDTLAAGVPRLVLMPRDMPLQDTLEVIEGAAAQGTVVLGPGTSGVMSVDGGLIGCLPAHDGEIVKPGIIGIAARSGALAILIARELSTAGFGVSAIIDLGDAPVVGTEMAEALRLLAAHGRTRGIVLAGSPGGRQEERAARAAPAIAKPVVAFLAGAVAPADRCLAHAETALAEGLDSHAGKQHAFAAAGVPVLTRMRCLPGALLRRFEP